MKKTLRFIWIPIILIIVGVAMVAKPLRNGIFTNYQENQPMNVIEKTLTQDFNNLKVSGNAIKKLNISFGEQASLQAKGHTQYFTAETVHETLIINTTQRDCYIRCNQSNYEFISLVLPLSFNGNIEVDSMNTIIEVKHSDAQMIQSIDTDGLNQDLTTINIQSNVRMNGLQSKANLISFQGSLEMDGLQASARVEPTGNTNIEMEGLNSQLVIRERAQSFNYDFELSSLSSTIIYHGKKTELGFFNQKKDNAFQINISADAMNQIVKIEE